MLLMSIFIVPVVFGQPTALFQQSDQTQTLNIVHPTDLVFPVNTDFKLHFHIYNSTGSSITLDPGDFCTIHLYNQTNNHIYSENLTLDSNNIDYHTSVYNLDKKGYYSFLVFCDTSNEDGFDANELKITEDGEDHEDKSVYVATGIMIVGAIGLLFSFAGSLQGDQDWMQPLKLLTYITGLFLILGGLSYGLQIIKYVTILEGSVVNIVGIIYFAGLFIVIPILLIFLVMFIVQLLQFWESLQRKSGGGWS